MKIPSMDGETSSMDENAILGCHPWMEKCHPWMEKRHPWMKVSSKDVIDRWLYHLWMHPWMDGWRRQMTDMDGAKVKRSRQKIFLGLNLFSGGFCSSVLRKTHFAISWQIFFKIQFWKKSANLWQNAPGDVAQGVWSSHRVQLNRVK